MIVDATDGTKTIPQDVLVAGINRAYGLTRTPPRCGRHTSDGCIAHGFQMLLNGYVDAESVSMVLIGWADRECRMRGFVADRDDLVEWASQIERTLEAIRLMEAER